MRSIRRRLLPAALLGVLAALVIAAPTASAAWTSLSAATGQNTDDPSTARAADGTLHLVYRERQGDVTRLQHRTLTANGRTWAAPTTVVGNWLAMTNPDIELIAGVPHAFWAGQGTLDNADPTSSGRAWSATLTGGAWTQSATPMTFRQSPSGSSHISSAVAADGATPWITWTGTGIHAIHEGLSQGAAEETNLSTGCCQYAENLARDAATGDIYVVWYSNETNMHGVYVRRIAPSLGDTTRLPLTASTEAVLGRTNRLAAAARTTGGVYSAYCDTYPSCTHVRVAGSSGPSLRRTTGATPANPSKVWTAAAPDGRMWLAWGNNDDQVFVVRSNRAMTRWSAVRRLAAPPATTDTWNLVGEGASGPLDLFANSTAAAGTSIWHERVLPSLSLQVVSVRRDGRGRPVVTLRSNDAGDAIGASIRLGRTTLVSRTNGLVRFILPSTTLKGSYVSARATKTGYVAASARVRIP